MSHRQTPRDIEDFKPRSVLLESKEVCAIINRFLSFKGEKKITANCIRQIFMPIVMELIKKFSPVGLGQICAYGEDFKSKHNSYRDSCLVSGGTNAWSAIWLTPDDSGYVMLQKIAAASLLSELIDMIGFESTPDEGKVDLDTLCMPIHVFRDNHDYLERLQDRCEIAHEQLGW